MNKINLLFPTVYSRSNINRFLTNRELEVFDFDNKNMTVQNNVGGNQVSSSGQILEHQSLANIKTFILQELNNFIDLTCKPLDPSLQIHITQSWFNVTVANNAHHLHNHSNSIFSGVFYIKTSKDDKLKFHKPKTNTIIWPFLEDNIYNSTTWWIPVTVGDLIIFDSSLLHEVPALDPEYVGERISLSFNTFFTGRFGLESEKTLLVIDKINGCNNKNS